MFLPHAARVNLFSLPHCPERHAGCEDGSNDNYRQSGAASMNRVRNSDCFFQAQPQRIDY